MKKVAYSQSKTILELAFIQLKDRALLFPGQIHYVEYRKNALKNFLKTEWQWDKKQVIQAIQKWRQEGFLELKDDDCLSFSFTEVVYKNPPQIILGIGNSNE